MRALLFLLVPGAALAAPAELAYTGHLLDSNGMAINGTPDLRVALYDGEGVGATEHWARTFSEVPVEHGYFSVVLSTDDDDDAIDTTWFSGGVWVGVSLGVASGGASDGASGGVSDASGLASGESDGSR